MNSNLVEPHFTNENTDTLTIRVWVYRARIFEISSENHNFKKNYILSKV